jgi:hypothetical protein
VPSKKIRDEVANRAKDRRTGKVLGVDRPDVTRDGEGGYDIRFIREGTTKTNTNYTAVEIDRDPSPLHDNPDIMGQWLEQIMEDPLPSVLNYYDADYIEKVLGGQVSRKEAEPEAERPRRRFSSNDDEPRETRRRPSLDDAESDAEKRFGRSTDGRDLKDRADEAPRNRRFRSNDDEQAERPTVARRPRDEEEVPWDDGKGNRSHPVDNDDPSAHGRAALERIKERRAG